MRKNIIILLLVLACVCSLFVIFAPQTSYVQYNEKGSTLVGIENGLLWDYRLYDDLSMVAFYEEVWQAGECVHSERITTISAPEKGTIVVKHFNSTDGFDSAPIGEYDKWVEIFKEDKDSSFIVVRMETS